MNTHSNHFKVGLIRLKYKVWSILILFTLHLGLGY